MNKFLKELLRNAGFKKWLKKSLGPVFGAAIIYVLLQISGFEKPSPAGRAQPSPAQKETVQVVSVTDGDTIKVLLNGNTVTVRLIGIDTPEIHDPGQPVECYGFEAKKAAEDLLLNKWVKLEMDRSETDRYGRILRYIWMGDLLVNEYLVQNGYARSYRYPPDTKYQHLLDTAQINAQTSLAGLWSSLTCAGNKTK